MEARKKKKCHYAGIKKGNSISWSHETMNNGCISVICDDLSNGMTIEQVWRKEYNYTKRIRGE